MSSVQSLKRRLGAITPSESLWPEILIAPRVSLAEIEVLQAKGKRWTLLHEWDKCRATSHDEYAADPRAWMTEFQPYLRSDDACQQH